VLTNELRLIAQRYISTYGEVIPCEQLVSNLCDVKQAYTQYGGKRPFGVSLLYMGWDTRFGFQLYQSDPSGNYSGWKATCIGRKSGGAKGILQQELFPKEYLNPTLEDAKDVAIKVLAMTLDGFSASKLEMATLERIDNYTSCKVLDTTEIQKRIEKYNKVQAQAAKRTFCYP